MNSINALALRLAFHQAQEAYEATHELQRQRIRGLDDRDSVKGNKLDAEEKLFGHGGFVNSIEVTPDEDRITFAQKALEAVLVNSKGKDKSIALQTAYISNVIEALTKYRGATPISFSDTAAQGSLDTTVSAQLGGIEAFADDTRPMTPLPQPSVHKGPHILKASLEAASGKAFETMVAKTPDREAAFRKANKGTSESDIKTAFSARLAEATGYLFHNPDSVMARLQDAQSAGKIKVILDNAYNGLSRQSKTMQPLVEASLDSFVKELKTKEPQFSYQKPALQRGA